MAAAAKIITIGLCPSWDTICELDRIEWGGHETVACRTDRPAGKAMNISRGLAWMGTKNYAAGLWGHQDYKQMKKALEPLKELIKTKLTVVEGRTRQNITVADRAKKREMHLRNESQLASKPALKKLASDLEKIVTSRSISVFAGALPAGGLLGDIIQIIRNCSGRGAKIAVDTSGPALRRIVNSGNVWLIKPNVEELSELSGRRVKDSTAALTKAAEKLLKKVEIVLVSRGRKGAIVVTKQGVWHGSCISDDQKVLSTVGCGDCLLAGFLKGLRDNPGPGYALETAIKVATAKAWGLTEAKKWPGVKRLVKVKVKQI